MRAPHAPFGKNLIRCTAGVAVQFAQHKQDGDKDEGHNRGKDGAQQVDDHLRNKVNISEVMHVMLPSTKYQRRRITVPSASITCFKLLNKRDGKMFFCIYRR